MNSLSVVDPERFLGSVRWRQLFDMDEQIQAQIARLESDVQHIHTVVSDIKVDLRRTNDKIDATNSRVDVLRDKFEQGFRDISARMDGLHEKQAEKSEAVRQDLSQKIEGVREDLTHKIDSVREDLTSVRHDIASMKVWAMGLYFALAGSLLFVMAKGFKWL
jgi:predicted  nucleic acid-binding Zn-ribbon protein